MKVVYKNKRGSLTFGGGSQADLNMTAIEGLGPVNKTVNSITYYGKPGIETTNITDGSRTITLSGDLLMSARAQYARMMSILDIPGTLMIYLPDGEARLIDVSYTSVVPGERYADYRTYVIQFNCDNPYFRSSNELMFRAYEKINHLNSSFSLPGIFTSEYGNTVLKYDGNATVEPGQIWIYAKEKEEVDVSTDEGIGILIENTTNGEFIRLEYPISAGDFIKIDVAGRSIKNQTGLELMEHVAKDSFLTGFHLEPGENRIRAYNYQGTLNVTVRIFYTDYFVEAVF